MVGPYYPRWGAHTSDSVATYAVLGAPASIVRSEFLKDPLWELRLFALPHPEAAAVSYVQPWAGECT